MESGRMMYKNKAQIEKEVQKAQHKLMQIFFKSLEDKMEQGKPVKKEEPAKAKIVAPVAIQAYNKFNDEGYTASLNDFKKGVTRTEDVEINPKLHKSLNEDPSIKAELSKYNYGDLVDLNRDFQFYINHPEKFKKINRAKLKRFAKKKPTGFDVDATDFGLDKENSGLGLLTQSRDIVKHIEQSRVHGFMSQKERRRLLKNLF
jgi:hypothetical protein